MGDADRRLCQSPAIRNSTRSTRTMSARTCRSPGRSPPACCAAMKAARWSIGDMMYVHTPFPNIVYALDLNNDGTIIWKYEPKQDPNVIPVMCCDTVNRGVAYARRQDLPAPGRHDAGGARRQDRRSGLAGQERRSRARARPAPAPVVVKDKVIVGISGGEFGVRGSIDRLQSQGRQAGLARLFDRARRRDADRSGEDHDLGKPVGKDSGTDDLGRRPVEDRRRHHLGLVLLRSEAEPRLLRHRQPLDLEPGAAARRQPLVDDHLRPRSRHRHGEVGLPDDAARRVGLRRRQRDDPRRPSTSTAQTRKALVHFDRNGFAYTLDRETGELLVAEKYDPAVNWATGVDMDKTSATYGRPQVRRQVLDRSRTART